MNRVHTRVLFDSDEASMSFQITHSQIHTRRSPLEFISGY